jgi:hypothetical protein
MKIDGRCHCGYVTFEAEADPEATTICNCTDCQTMSGAPLRAVIITQPGTFVLLSGKPTEYRRLPIAETSVCKVSALIAGRRSMRHRLAMSKKPTMCGLDRCANEMNWCHAGRYLFARSRHGSTTSTRSRNSTGRRIDPRPMVTGLKSRSAAVSCRTEVCYPYGWKHGRRRAVKRREFNGRCPVSLNTTPDQHAGRLFFLRRARRAKDLRAGRRSRRSCACPRSRTSANGMRGLDHLIHFDPDF